MADSRNPRPRASSKAVPISNPSDAAGSRPTPTDLQAAASRSAPHWTVFIRLPFPRHDFEDPPPVEWNSSKDKALWKIISKTSNSKEVDWEGMSAEFGVTLPFLLQQAAWLYERHFENMRSQMKRIGVSAGASAVSSPVPAPQDEHSTPPLIPGLNAVPTLSNTGKDSTPRLLPQSSMKASPLASGGLRSVSGSPRFGKPNLSRTGSTSTVTQSRTTQYTSRQHPKSNTRGSGGSQHRPILSSRANHRSTGVDDDDDEAIDANTEDRDLDSDSSDEESPIGQKTTTRRTAIATKPTSSQLSSDGEGENDDEDGSGGYLPFASTYKSAKEDPMATLRASPRKQPAQTLSKNPSAEPEMHAPDSSASSAASSAQQPPRQAGRRGSTDAKYGASDRPGPLSPRHRAQLEQLSPRYRKSGSEGSPSMGSSFSDLDDASVTQSALEDALLSNMQHGSIGMGIGSRMSSLRDGLTRK